MRWVRIFAPMLAVALAACESPTEEKPKPEPVTFLEDARDAGASVYLRGKMTNDRLVVDVVTHGSTSIQGVAFRLVWDPAALGFASATAANVWSSQAIMLAKEGTPGQLAVAWAEKGETTGGITLSGETVLGTMVFTAKTQGAASLAFRPERSSVMDASGARVAVSWRGGTVLARSAASPRGLDADGVF